VDPIINLPAMTEKISSLILFFVIFLPGVYVAYDPDTDQLNWPMEIESEMGIVTTLYQPQLESFQNNDLEGRMAVAIKAPEEEMIFGALWFRARMLTDLDNRTVLLEKMEIIKTHFPDVMDDGKIRNY
jgi:hypothetical protein